MLITQTVCGLLWFVMISIALVYACGILFHMWWLHAYRKELAEQKELTDWRKENTPVSQENNANYYR